MGEKKPTQSVSVRLPIDLYERCKEDADRHTRNLNEQILYYIQKGKREADWEHALIVKEKEKVYSSENPNAENKIKTRTV